MSKYKPTKTGKKSLIIPTISVALAAYLAPKVPQIPQIILTGSICAILIGVKDYLKHKWGINIL